MRSPPPFDPRVHALIRATCHRMAIVLRKAAAGRSVVATCFEGVANGVWQCSYGMAACVSQSNADLRRLRVLLLAHEEAEPAGTAPHSRYCSQPAVVVALLTYVRGDTAADVSKRADRCRRGDLLRWHRDASASDDDARTSGGRYLECGAVPSSNRQHPLVF